jgi:threonine/homoserine/homoserine lactone efflux protein
MTLLEPLLFGILLSFLGILPPGLINMTVAKVSMKEGKTRAFFFALGATIIIFIQTFLALLFAKFLDKNPPIILLFREVGMVVFAAITFYLFWTSKKLKLPKKEIKLKSKKSRFFLGMLLSSLNFFPIPFYVFASITLSFYNFFDFEKTSIYLFVLGSGIGSLLAFYCYITFFKKMETKATFMLQNMNYIIGTITGLVSAVTLINVINHYWN